MTTLLSVDLALGAMLELAQAAETASVLIMEITDNAITPVIPGGTDVALGSDLF